MSLEQQDLKYGINVNEDIKRDIDTLLRESGRRMRRQKVEDICVMTKNIFEEFVRLGFTRREALTLTREVVRKCAEVVIST